MNERYAVLGSRNNRMYRNSPWTLVLNWQTKTSYNITDLYGSEWFADPSDGSKSMKAVEW